MLRRMGFCSKWVTWIVGCLNSASISVLINGSSSAELIPQKELRQGDQLTPLLFNIVTEGLTGLMREALDNTQLKGFMVGRNMVEISILQYADNMIFFGEASMENIKAIKVMLRSFELVSGLKINFAKSHFEPMGMQLQWMRNIASYLNCSLLPAPFSHLGVPIGANPRSCVTWDPIIKK